MKAGRGSDARLDARKAVRDAPIHAALGPSTFPGHEEHLEWTGRRLRALGAVNLVGAHSRGIEAVFRLRETAGPDRRHAVVGAVVASFTLGSGDDPLSLAR